MRVGSARAPGSGWSVRNDWRPSGQVPAGSRQVDTTGLDMNPATAASIASWTRTDSPGVQRTSRSMSDQSSYPPVAGDPPIQIARRSGSAAAQARTQARTSS